MFTIGSCDVSWKATLQPVIAMSTTEAEYMAIADVCKESVWLKGLFAELCEMILELTCSVIVKVSYISLKIRCFIRGQSTLISSTIMFVMWSHKVS